MFGSFGWQEVVAIAFLILLLFGAKRIPEYMRGLGEGIRELRRGVQSVVDEVEKEGTDGQA